MSMGFSTFCIKPSIFIDDRAAHAAFCRDVVHRVSEIS
jgi:hypothetical protein